MLLRPDLRVNAVYDLSPDVLKGHAIEGVMVDLDDTLVPAKSETMEPRFREWLGDLKEASVPTLILSNGWPKRVAKWSEELGLEAFSLVGKPWWFAYRRGLKVLGTPASNTAMVGDQLFTDVLGANLAGLKSILVAPLSPGGMPHTRAARRLEARILKGGHGGRSLNR